MIDGAVFGLPTFTGLIVWSVLLTRWRFAVSERLTVRHRSSGMLCLRCWPGAGACDRR